MGLSAHRFKRSGTQHLMHVSITPRVFDGMFAEALTADGETTHLRPPG